MQVELLSSLLRHLAPVNCVRFSPDGQMLASGSDDGFVILWKLVDGPPDLSKELPEGESPNVSLMTVQISSPVLMNYYRLRIGFRTSQSTPTRRTYMIFLGPQTAHFLSPGLQITQLVSGAQNKSRVTH